MSATKIEYLDRSWSPIAMRCGRLGPGCDHCWHLAMCKRHAANPRLPKGLRDARAGGRPVLLEDTLRQPLSWRKPQRVGVNFMGDLFHGAVPWAYLDRIWDVMWDCPQHTFVVLTKRPRRLVEFIHRRAYRPSFGWGDLDRPALAKGDCVYYDDLVARNQCGWVGSGEWQCDCPFNEEGHHEPDTCSEKTCPIE